jgi:hypothetical protein
MTNNKINKIILKTIQNNLFGVLENIDKIFMECAKSINEHGELDEIMDNIEIDLISAMMLIENQNISICTEYDKTLQTHSKYAYIKEVGILGEMLEDIESEG